MMIAILRIVVTKVVATTTVAIAAAVAPLRTIAEANVADTDADELRTEIVGAADAQQQRTAGLDEHAATGKAEEGREAVQRVIEVAALRAIAAHIPTAWIAAGEAAVVVGRGIQPIPVAVTTAIAAIRRRVGRRRAGRRARRGAGRGIQRRRVVVAPGVGGRCGRQAQNHRASQNARGFAANIDAGHITISHTRLRLSVTSAPAAPGRCPGPAGW